MTPVACSRTAAAGSILAMVKLRLPRTLAYVAFSGGLALGAAACTSSGGGRTDAAVRDAAVADAGAADAALADAGGCAIFCIPNTQYDDGGAIPSDALADCPACASDGGALCPAGCRPVG